MQEGYKEIIMERLKKEPDMLRIFEMIDKNISNLNSDEIKKLMSVIDRY